MSLNFDFNPMDFYVSEQHHISNDLWVELDGKENVPTSTKKRFYTASKNAKKEWHEELKTRYNIEEYIFYDPAITGLINEVTPEMSEEVRLSMNKYFFETVDGKSKPVPPPTSIIVQEVLETLKIRLMARRSGGELLEMLADENNPIKRIQKKRKLTNFEKRLLQWRPDYGFLVDLQNMEGILFPRPKNLESYRYEIVREYLFHIPQFPEVILSLAQEPNSDRAIWGLRRTMNLDWPFDDSRNSFIEELALSGTNVDGYVNQMNDLIEGLEKIICK